MQCPVADLVPPTFSAYISMTHYTMRALCVYVLTMILWQSVAVQRMTV